MRSLYGIDVRASLTEVAKDERSWRNLHVIAEHGQAVSDDVSEPLALPLHVFGAVESNSVRACFHKTCVCLDWSRTPVFAPCSSLDMPMQTSGSYYEL